MAAHHQRPPATTDGGARYPVGPSKGRSNGESSAPGVADEGGRRGAPEGERAGPSSVRSAAEEAALRRVARRRRREPVRRAERVDVRYSVAEKRAILTRARSLNIAGAHLVGAAVMAYLDGELTLPGQRTAVDDLVDELAALRAQVARLGGNVNQIARALNSQADPQPVDAVVLTRAQRLLETVHSTIAALDTAAHRTTAGRPTAT
ncbi:plasmid mobilization relaxosome protein MobC [Streptomyces sp. 3MP-14]|uniref:Plasmid mobilization relaxosome protein MobC n=1 Tax=Streptomyces mimosae TaxID=2586635 RepID=A0A5N5ZZ95_9ACTN|nr:plasmid mobilization relaxosome protein MobC [Streptomyces mimosae]KAB8174931.1 plasmid mobilization relaxosome protein MobC [Streptomyces sp. 3MP-14]